MPVWTPSEPSRDTEVARRKLGASGHHAGGERSGTPRALASPLGEGLPASLRVVPWPSADASTVGRPAFPASHRYVEILWTPVLGPAQVILLRRLSEVARPQGGHVPTAELLVAIGGRCEHNGRVGRSSLLGKGIARLARFRLAAWESHGTLAVVARVPAVSDRDLARLPESFHELHRRFIDDHDLRHPA